MQPWNYDHHVVEGGRATVYKVAGGHMVAGASSEKTIYRSFDKVNGVNEYTGVQGVEWTIPSRSRTMGIGLVQSREDQIDYGAPSDYRYSGTGFIMYVSTDGAIRIEEKAGAGQRRLKEMDNVDSAENTPTTRKLSQQAAGGYFCNYENEHSGYCDLCQKAQGSGYQESLTSYGRDSYEHSCSGYSSDLPPPKYKKRACSKTVPCAANHAKVSAYDQSEEIYISAVCPPRLQRFEAAAYGGTQQAAASNGYRRKLQVGDPCHFGFAYPGDAFAITVDSESLRVQYWHNGRVIYTSEMVPNFPMMVDAYMIDQGAKASNIVWKCPPKRCTSGTTSKQCERLRAKPPSGCNFINENYDSAPILAPTQPYLKPPKTHGPWWIWVISVAVILCCCGCGYFRFYGIVFPCCGFVAKTSTPVSLPPQQGSWPVSLPANVPRVPVPDKQQAFSPVALPSQSPQSQSNNFLEMQKKLGLV
jgi:hypothetical protein